MKTKQNRYDKQYTQTEINKLVLRRRQGFSYKEISKEMKRPVHGLECKYSEISKKNINKIDYSKKLPQQYIKSTIFKIKKILSNLGYKNVPVYYFGPDGPWKNKFGQQTIAHKFKSPRLFNTSTLIEISRVVPGSTITSDNTEKWSGVVIYCNI